MRAEGGHSCASILQDPNAHEDAPLVIDRVRFEEAWTGDIILVKRNYDIADETQPFSIGFIAALIFRERWIVRDVAICALVLGFHFAHANYVLAGAVGQGDLLQGL